MRALLLILFALLSFPAFSSPYIKVANNGTDLPNSAPSFASAAVTLAPYTDNGDGTVSDPRTGLTWMRCAMGQTWTGSTCSGTASPYTWAAAVALTGATSFAGKSDWRLPNIRELQSIADRSAYNPAINTAAFPNTSSSSFWSGSPYASYSSNAWSVYFGLGNVGGSDRYLGYLVRLVRGGQSFGLLNLARPTSDYVAQGNGTATHTPSGLIWKRCAEGQTWSGSTCTGSASTYTWDAAQGLSSPFAGQSDWRLPTVEELSSLVDYTTSNLAINMKVFPNTSQSSGFWSGSPGAYLSYGVWGVGFYDGSVYGGYRNDDIQVRLVRGGQSFDTFALSLSSTGSGSGTLTSNSGGLNCASAAGTSSGTCSASLASGTVVTLTATPAAGSIFVGWSGACSGTTTTCSLTMDAVKNVTANFNSAALAAQTITFGPAPTVTVGNTGLLSAIATSGLPVTISSNTLDICTVSGSTVRGVTAGYCTLAANQAGNSSFSPAAPVTQSFSITAAAPQPPGPPTNVLITAGQGSAMINFSAPSGSTIAYYTASCAAIDQTTRTATGSTSPLTVKNLTGGVLYQCTLTATDGDGLTSIASASTPVTPAKKSSLTPILMLLLD